MNESIPTRAWTAFTARRKKQETKKEVNQSININKLATNQPHASIQQQFPYRSYQQSLLRSIEPTRRLIPLSTSFNSKQHLPLVTFSFSFLRSSCWKLFTLFFFFGIPIARRRDDDRPTDRPTTGVFYFHGSIPFQFLVIMVRM